MMARWRTMTASAALMGLVAGCASQSGVSDADTQASTQLDAVTADVWAWHLTHDLTAQRDNGMTLAEIADITPAALAGRAHAAKNFLKRVDAIDRDRLSQSDRLTAGFLAWYLEDHRLAPQTDRFTFAMAPYSGGWFMSGVVRLAAQAPVDTPEQRAAYLIYLSEFADLISQSEAKTRRQADQGVYFPKPAIPGAIGVLTSLRERANTQLIPGADRLATLDEAEHDGFRGQAQAIVADEIVPALDRFIAALGPDYIAQAPETVGLAQYPDGREEYQRRIRYFTGQDHDPATLHAAAIERMVDIDARMTELRHVMGFDGPKQDFNRVLRTDPRYTAETPEDVAALYMHHIRRIEPLVDTYFTLMPDAPYGVQRADPATEAGLSFGFFQPPSADEPRGLYLFNGARLDERTQVNAAALIYHELIPGHHFHLALQAENDDLPPIRRLSGGLGMSAFAEGWAEYASKLGYEMGLYADPKDEYGQLLGEYFLTARIVLDTGMNALGWSLEDARAYLADHPFLSDAMVNTETLRYSTDIPGQALAYKQGDLFLWELRARAEEALGDRFDLREFHAVILEEGSLPLNLLEEHITWYIDKTLAEGDG